jgi:lactobin A/cerein 7B family class IIb bacteriocin
MTNNFTELSNCELYEIDGGFVIWAAVIGFCVGGCMTAGVFYGYHKESQGKWG